jgi:L-fucose mutarotase/ribose pyranase (RbsD/FucU family)
MNKREKSKKIENWERELIEKLELFGHRNWIVIADSAYPAQSKPGIETILANSDQLPVVEKALQIIAGCKHVRANVYTDLELEFVSEKDAPGISKYRKKLNALLKGSISTQLPHEEIIARLDQCAQIFRILIIKTNLTIPYTSVFFELDCGYWNADAERRLRSSMQR